MVDEVVPLPSFEVLEVEFGFGAVEETDFPEGRCHEFEFQSRRV